MPRANNSSKPPMLSMMHSESEMNQMMKKGMNGKMKMKPAYPSMKKRMARTGY